MKTLQTQDYSNIYAGIALPTPSQAALVIDLLESYGHLLQDCAELGAALGELSFELTHSDEALLGPMLFEPQK